MKTIQSITPRTRICAIIGNPVIHSLSPAIHNAAFAALDLDFVYVAFRVEDVAAALGGMRAMENFRGMSVTIPHKVEVMNHVDRVADVDRHIGAINTVINESGHLFGFGTDGPGALKALTDAGVPVAGKNVLMLGAGGASRAIAFTLTNEAAPAAITILDINETVLAKLQADLTNSADESVDISAAKMTDSALTDAMAAADIVIHCTPVGMHPKEGISIVPPGLFRPGQTVFDIVYTPLDTRLLKDARARGLQVVSGVEMFVNQAILQFERFTGEKAPVEVMRNVVMEQLKK